MPGRTQRRRGSPAPVAPAPRDFRLSPAALLGLAVVALVVSAGAYWAIVPLGEGPDEGSHLLFVRTLAGEIEPAAGWAWGLPRLATDPTDENFEVHQPPLYYALAAVAWRLGGLPAVRLLSLLLTALLVWVVGRSLAEVAGADLAAGAAWLVAVWPMVGFQAARVGNDPLVNLLWATTIWCWLRMLGRGPSARLAGLAGLSLGAALLTKQTSLGLLPLTLVAAALGARLHGRRVWALAGWTLLLAALLAGWWYLRNRLVYGDWFAQRVFDERFLAHRPTPERLAAQFAHRPGWSYPAFVFEWVVTTSVLYVGHDLLRLPREVYPAHLTLFGAALVAAAVGLVRRWRRGFDAAVATGLLLAAGMLLCSLLLWRFNQTYFQAQGRYLFVLLPGWALAACAGPSRLWPPGGARRWGVAVLPLWFGLLNVIFLGVYLPPLYASR